MTTRKSFKGRVRHRKGEQGQRYCTARMHEVNAASSAAEVRKSFRRMAEDMRAGRAGWAPGPDVDLSWWEKLPEVPLELDVERPTRPLLVVDLGALECPAHEVVARGIVRGSDLTSEDHDGSIMLGTVTIQDGAGTRTVHRLPPPLGTWAAGQIGHTRRYGNLFPAYLGFCTPRRGNYCVEFLPPPPPATEEAQRAQSALDEWLALPELPIIEIAEAAESGSRYEVLKVGAFFVPVAIVDRGRLAESASDARAGVKVRRKSAAEFPALNGLVADDADRVALPTATVWTLAGRITYRLPPSLAGWVLLSLTAAARGANPFPTEVEFSRLNGRYTADFTDVPGVGSRP